MARLTWSDRSLELVDKIADYITRDSGRAASRVVEAIAEKGLAIAESPYQGAMVPEYDDETVRERQLFDYRVIYRVKDDEVVILLVWHGAQPLPDELPDWPAIMPRKLPASTPPK